MPSADDPERAEDNQAGWRRGPFALEHLPANSVAYSWDGRTSRPAAEETTNPVTGETVAPVADTSPPASRSSDARAGMAVGIGLVLIGLWFLLREYLPDLDWSLIWPLVVVGIGAAILVTSMGRR